MTSVIPARKPGFQPRVGPQPPWALSLLAAIDALNVQPLQVTPNCNPPPTQDLCDQCNSRPKYVDSTRTHPYCGRTCAVAAAKANQTTGDPRPSTPLPKITEPICTIPGCQKPAYKNDEGVFGDFCSIAHKKLATEACLLCLKVTKRVGNYCSKKCADDAQRKGPAILEVPAGHVLFKSVAEQFEASWRHTNKACPTVRYVYKVIGTKDSLGKYDAYRDAVEGRGRFVGRGRSVGNENRRWHGTRRECNLGDKGQAQFCNSKSCSLCCIIRTSYDLAFVLKATGWGRFGAGIYTSSTSSKSDDYAKNGGQSNLKAVLLNKVVVGKGCKLTQNNDKLTAAPAGYDSVLGEKGGKLNYDEVVVYTNDAVRPSYLVLYDA